VGDVVGVIGLGAMGAPMAANLERAGNEVASYDIRGDGSSGSVAEVAARATRAVIVVVRTRPQVEEVVAQLDRAGLDVLIMSTIDPSTMAHLAQDLARRGLTAVDAPVSGGVAGAEAGTLAIMVAGDPAAVERCRPLLEAMGRSDRPGMGQAVKLANQLMLTVSLLAVQEGLRLAGEYGLQPEDVLPVIGRSTGASWAATNWETVLGWWRDYQPGGALDVIVKDVRSLLDYGAERRVPLPWPRWHSSACTTSGADHRGGFVSMIGAWGGLTRPLLDRAC
jgi:3-hydroxyisobutyrate dehydrogenase